MSNGFVTGVVYLLLVVIEFPLNILQTVFYNLIFLYKLIKHYISYVNMVEKSQKRKRSLVDEHNQTVAVRGVISANWQKFLNSNLIMDKKEEKPPQKEHFTGTFRRARKKKLHNEIQNAMQNDLKTLNLDPQSDPLVSNDGLENNELKSNETVSNNKKNKLTKFIAMDCEMVGVGYDGNDHMLARISLVNKFGDCIYDKFVKPREEVKDYRTDISGVRKEDLMNGEDFSTVQKEVSELLKGRILVGHSLKNDLSVLFLSHPKRCIRDTARYKPFRKITKGSTPSLKRLAKEVLGIDIQHGEHSSVEDARAAMQLYCTVGKKWEMGLSDKRGYRKITED